MRSSGFVDIIDKRNFAPDIFGALEIAKAFLDSSDIERTR